MTSNVHLDSHPNLHLTVLKTYLNAANSKTYKSCFDGGETIAAITQAVGPQIVGPQNVASQIVGPQQVIGSPDPKSVARAIVALDIVAP